LTVYADTSFLFSLYVPDTNSSATTAIVKRIQPPLLATDFVEFEFVNAINGRIFRKELRASEEQAVLLSFSRDIHAGAIRIAPLSAATFVHARRLARVHTPLLGTSALDVLHVASALSLRADSFCTFDKNQAKLAAAVGLRVHAKQGPLSVLPCNSQMSTVSLLS
jgi:predicted nucleic acid-binding protein